jgi:hypothetical protein
VRLGWSARKFFIFHLLAYGEGVQPSRPLRKPDLFMSKKVLIVDSIDARRTAIQQALASRRRATLEVSDAFSAMGALGRHDFGAVVVAEGKRSLTLQSMCSLARKRHPSIKIFVMLSSLDGADGLQDAIGDGALMVPPDWGVEQLGNEIERAVEQYEAAVAEQDASSTADEFEKGAPSGLSLAGSLEGGSGPALLMALFAQELTGYLKVDTEKPVGQMYFFRGEPVWAEAIDGDAGLFRAMVNFKLLASDASPEPVPEGMLLGSLIQNGTITGKDAYNFMRQFLREQVLELATNTEGRYSFEEDTSFLKYAPLLRVNPFGLIFESRRRRYTPDELIPLGHEMAEKYVWPGPALRIASPKLSPFSRGKDVAELMDGTITTQEYYTDIGLDMLMGTLMVVTMVEAKLAILRDRPMEPEERTTPDLNLSGSSHPLWAHYADPLGTEEEEENLAAWQEKILETYARLGNAATPAQVLGVPRFADRSDIENGHSDLITLFDQEGRLPVMDADLRYKVAEMRARVERAFTAIMLHEESVPLEGDTDSNPF